MLAENRTESVVVRMQIAAEQELVWTFLSDQARFASWIGAMGGGSPQPGTELEPRVGGQVRVVYSPTIAARGEVVVFEAPRRFVMTWGYEGHEQGGIRVGSTRVEITLRPVPGGTEVELRHSGIPSEAERAGHLGGWTHYLSMLSRAALEAQHEPALADRVGAYYRAWGERDEAARQGLLEACCEPEARVRTSYACTNSIAELSSHIANAQRHMAGMTLQPDGAAQHLQGYARSQWTVTAPDGAVVFRGVNFFTLTAATRFSLVVGFSDR